VQNPRACVRDMFGLEVPASKEVQVYDSTSDVAASRLLWKIEKAYSLGIPKKQLAHGVSQTEEEHAYARRYTIWW
jgi:hypothetical protein